MRKTRIGNALRKKKKNQFSICLNFICRTLGNTTGALDGLKHLCIFIVDGNIF